MDNLTDEDYLNLQEIGIDIDPSTIFDDEGDGFIATVESVDDNNDATLNGYEQLDAARNSILSNIADTEVALHSELLKELLGYEPTALRIQLWSAEIANAELIKTGALSASEKELVSKSLKPAETLAQYADKVIAKSKLYQLNVASAVLGESRRMESLLDAAYRNAVSNYNNNPASLSAGLSAILAVS